MKDYSAMSDYLINQHVAESLTGRYLYFPDYVWDSEEEKRFDPCNNPGDTWPIILNNGINIFTDMIPHGLLGQARVSVISGGRIGAECLIAKHINPLRAAMEVYLMMKDAEKCDG